MIRFREVSFRYATAEQWVVRRANFDIAQGNFCLVCGPSGSGKSTLLRLINGLVPHFSGGIVEGEIQVNGINPIHVGPAAMCRLVGFVFQDPETQFILDNVEDEIAFNLENAAIPPQQIAQRIEETLHALGILHLRRRRLEGLSGGEKQKVAIATVLSLAPSILVLDEPTSQLDGQSAEEILSLIQRLARQQKLTIVVAEHRLDRLLHFANQLIYLSGIGEPIRADEPQQVLPHMATVPPVVELGKRLGVRPLPLSISEGQQMVRKLGLERLNHRTSPFGKKQMDSAAGPAILLVEKVSVSFGKTQALSEVTLQLFASQITCLMGPNGAGKTTLLRAILGLVPLHQGRIWLQANEITTTPSWKRARWIGYLPQDPNALLFSETVLEELLITLRNHSLPEERGKAETILERLGLSDH
ncbi:MAG: ABC transporter ATP-binding protein, partial [Anaerolineales bacterium]